MHSLIGQMRTARRPILVTYDALCWILGFFGVALLQHAAGVTPADRLLTAAAAGLACGVAHVAIGAVVRLHQGRAVVGSFADAMLLAAVIAGVGAGSILADLFFGPFYRFSLAVMAPIAAAALMAWGRALYRMLREQGEISRIGGASLREPVVVIGAGDAARQLLTSMRRDPSGRWRPVAMVDDDPLKRYRRLAGVAVVGRTHDFPEVAERLGARTVIMAVPSASQRYVREINTLAGESGLDLKVLPSVAELLEPGKADIADIRDIDVTDLLGRHQIDTDVASIAGYLTGKRVLVTGAGGSIGSELCRQIAQFGPAELIMLDRDESALHAVQLSIYGKAMLDTDDIALCDIRDTQYVLDLFERRRPQVVFHAAALKHMPLLEQNPGEAVKTNVWGTLTILEAAAKVGVEKFVNISTDKAANPCNVLGYSKRLAEGLTAGIAQQTHGTYLSVRFGNVLGSRGSVLTAFAAQIAAGNPITVTDRRVTRYFMTIREAVQLVIQAAAIGRDGEALVLDMGDPVSIDHVARQLIELSGKDIEIVYTGLREGEKLHEELLGRGEPDHRPVHPLISHAPVPAYDSLDARGLDPWGEAEEVTRTMAVACAALVRDLIAQERAS